MSSFPTKSPLNNKNIIATIASDGQVYSLDNNTSNFVKMLTFPNMNLDDGGESMLRTTPAAILDMGKNLIQYAKDDNVDGVAEMMNKGAPFTSDWLGMTPIHFAVVNNSVAVTNVLLNAGVSLDVKTKVDRTPLHLAAFYGHEEIAEMILASGKCAVNSKDFFKMTPLHWAVEKRHKNIVRLLLRYDADPTVISKFGKTPIAIAVQTEQPDILEILESTKNSQQSKKFNEQSMKEATDAVNSILGLTEPTPPVELEDEDNKVRAIICNHDDDDDHSADVDSMINITNNLNENENQTALDMLKNHGISMMTEDDEDPSSNLLTSALQSGRTLVLSEGGKLVLNDTKMAVPSENKPKIITNSKPAMHYINTVDKKNSMTVGNKNVRIISMEELQKLNSDKFKPNLKRVTKVPQTIQQTTPRKVFMNPKVTQQMNPITRRIEESSEDETSIKIPKITSGTFTTNLNELERRKPTPLKVIKHTPTGAPAIGAIKINQQRFTPNQTTNIQPPQKSKGPVLPLLNSADTSREIFLLKKQVKEMKFKMDDITRDNEQLRRRIDKLEGLKLENESLSARLEHVEKLLCNQIAIENPITDDVIEEEFEETFVENI